MGLNILNKTLLKGSFVLLIAFGLFNFFHFLFQFFMARMLSVSDYGVLAALFAIIYIFTIFTESIQIIITKYSTNENDKSKLKNILKRSFNKGFYMSSFLFIFYLIISIPLSFILKINYLLLMLNGMVIFLAVFIPINRGIMQGKERFKPLGINMIVESCTKVVFGLIVVYLGFRVYGAIIGVLSGGVLALSFSFLQLRDIIKSKEKKAKIIGIYDYAKPAFLITTIIVMFYSMDVILARIFFPPEIAGSYAIASVLGKIIFWGTLPISKAMFPISAGNSLDKKKSESVFGNALGIAILCLSLILLLFYFFPELIIKIFSGKFIPVSVSILFYVGIAFSFISIANLVLLYKLSRGKVRGYLYLLVFIIIEILLLGYFSKSLFQYSIAFITASAIFLWGVIVLIRE